MQAKFSVGGIHSCQGVQIDSTDKTYCLAPLCCSWQNYICLTQSWNTGHIQIKKHSSSITDEYASGLSRSWLRSYYRLEETWQLSVVQDPGWENTGQHQSPSISSPHCDHVLVWWLFCGDVAVTLWKTVQFCYFRPLASQKFCEKFFHRKKNYVFKPLFHNENHSH